MVVIITTPEQMDVSLIVALHEPAEALLSLPPAPVAVTLSCHHCTSPPPAPHHPVGIHVPLATQPETALSSVSRLQLPYIRLVKVD